MKSILSFLCLFPLAVHAQKLELGLGVGFSMNSKPSDNMPFKGDIITVNYAASVDVLYNIGANWQTGLEASISELSRKSTLVYYTYFGVPVGNNDKKIVYAKSATSLSVVFNRKFHTKTGYAYAGVAAGYVGAKQDSKTLGSNESYRAPDGGKGPVFGLQVGYVHALSSRIGFFAQGAFRYYSLSYDAAEPTGTTSNKLKYNIKGYPVVLGIRIRFLNDDMREKERQDMMQIGL
jgi:hypothetical protein